MKLVAFCLFIFLISCEKRPSLTDGHQLVRWYGSIHVISTPNNEVLIFADVDEVEEQKSSIIGFREDMKRRGHNSHDQPSGYFIYDKKSKDLQLGLTKQQFDQRLQDLQLNPVDW